MREAVGLVAPVFEVRDGGLQSRQDGRGFPELHEALWIAEGEGAQEDGVDHLVDRGVRAHAESDREDRGEGERRAAA